MTISESTNGRWVEVPADDLARANLLWLLQRAVRSTEVEFLGRFRHFCMSMGHAEPQLWQDPPDWQGDPPLNYLVRRGNVLEVGFMGDVFLVGGDSCTK